MNVPVYQALIEYLRTGPVPFHMPGHKMGRGLPHELLDNLAALDLTEIPGTDNLHDPTGAVKEAQELASQAFGADRTFFLINGSTCGIHAAVMTVCKPHDRLIVARDCHKSVINGMIMAGVSPVYIKPEFDRTFGITTVITPDMAKRAFVDNPDAVGLLMTRPNYYGICSDIKQIAAVVHSLGKILIVDEAHGAHLEFCGQLPVSAMAAGADICVQSAHKTLPAFTQGAYLHIKGARIDTDRMRFNLSMLQSSSPSYIIMASLDIARAIMQQKGQELLSGLIKCNSMLERDIKAKTQVLMLDEGDLKGGSRDRTRLVFNFRNIGRTGFEIEKMLRKKHNIQVEMSDFYNVVCITTVSDSAVEMEKLSGALEELACEFKTETALDDICLSEPALPSQAVELSDIRRHKGKTIKLNEAAGEVSLGMITPYPPGIPLVCPGEIIDLQMIEHIKDNIKFGGTVTGIGENMEIQVIDKYGIINGGSK